MALGRGCGAKKLTFLCVKGHGSRANNVRCDRLTTEQARMFGKRLTEHDGTETCSTGV